MLSSHWVRTGTAIFQVKYQYVFYRKINIFQSRKILPYLRRNLIEENTGTEEISGLEVPRPVRILSPQSEVMNCFTN